MRVGEGEGIRYGRDCGDIIVGGGGDGGIMVTERAEGETEKG